MILEDLTEDQIERRVERRTDAADIAFIAGRISVADYDIRLQEIARWAERQYAKHALLKRIDS